ncbi:RsmB/NOP family class I SAM-dependent RNA methyltransferase [Patescibacteria group bacterium]
MEKKDLFIQKIQKMFGPRHVRILQHMYTRPPLTFRVNTEKVNKNDALRELRKQRFSIKPGPLDNSYIVLNEPENLRLSQTDLFNQGKIYIQNLSSMVPVFMLGPQEGEKILDMCAAPGSKTSQMSVITKQNAQIVAVDNNKKRVYKLEDNLNRQGVKNVEVIYGTAVGLEKRYELFNQYFDKVLLDAPCSNEGLIILTEPKTFEYWNPKKPRSLSKLQKKLISSAISMLAPGGHLVYSTCTFSKEENEDIVIWTLSRFKNVSLLEVKKILPDGLFTGFFAAKFVKLE